MQVGKSKIGRFLLFISLILLVVFFAMDQAKHPNYWFFCIGVVVLLLGGLLMLRGQKPPPDESMRFRTLRRWREQQRQRKAERNKKPFGH